MSPLVLLSVYGIYVFGFISNIFGYSCQFGYMHPAAVPIYEAEISWDCAVRYMKYADNALSGDSIKFTINLILVFDESQPESTIKAAIVQGGIGFNYTTLRLSCAQFADAESRSAKVTVLIYGLPIEQ
ncbi:uncharacterized protein [Drosophila virilis]|uniref:Uncharacterized protein n=1 Tax=Drosophila virilis TaxID=7244 RepID=A0A0Q9WGA8_DROVI|nr:uncharacterized protein LOC26530413 [Drosophila virilis]KRF80452.1 uncharacterized protein Dvir_GJ25643 [Drosophila virilis]